MTKQHTIKLAKRLSYPNLTKQPSKRKRVWQMEWIGENRCVSGASWEEWREWSLCSECIVWEKNLVSIKYFKNKTAFQSKLIFFLFLTCYLLVYLLHLLMCMGRGTCVHLCVPVYVSVWQPESKPKCFSWL